MDKNEIEQLYRAYFDTLYRICFLYMKCEADALDMVQETFVKLMRSDFKVQSEEKTKAWLIVTASNCCKTQLAKWWRKKRELFDEVKWEQQTAKSDGPSVSEVLRAVLELEEKYRIVTYLYYYEGYKTGEIGKMLHISRSTVQTRLARARKILKLELGEYDCKERRGELYES